MAVVFLLLTSCPPDSVPLVNRIGASYSAIPTVCIYQLLSLPLRLDRVVTLKNTTYAKTEFYPLKPSTPPRDEGISLVHPDTNGSYT